MWCNFRRTCFFVADIDLFNTKNSTKSRQKADKMGDKMGTFFSSVLSYDRDKKTNVNNSLKRRYLRTLIFCTWEFVQLISGRFFMAKPGDAPFLYQVCTRMYRMTMKVVSFTGGAAGVYAVLRAIVTGERKR